MTSEKKINWGIMGLGKIARTFAEDLQRAENASIQGVASRSEEKSRAFATEFDAVNSYGSYAELAADPEIHIVYVATPHPMHFENTMMCLKQGKHVLCEKPMGMNAADVSAMIAEAQERNLFLMEGIWTRFIPATNLLLALIEKGSIGEVISVRADFGFKGNPDPKARLLNKELGGGSLMDIGIYPAYLSLLVLGVPAKIQAMARMSETSVDTFCAMLFEYPKQSAVLESSFVTDTPTEAFVFGGTGTLKLHGDFHHSRKVTLYRKGQMEQTFKIEFLGNGYVHEIEEVHHCLNNKLMESPKLPLKTSLELITVLDRVRTEIGLDYPVDFDN